MGWFDKICRRWKCWIRKLIHLIVCLFGPKPPKGDTPTSEQKTRIEGAFPNLERIMHIKTELEGGSYGDIIRCYEKQDSSVNLDLC